MSALDDYTTGQLEAELERRGARRPEPCGSCRKFKTYVGVYDADGYTRRCSGCLRAVARCTC